MAKTPTIPGFAFAKGFQVQEERLERGKTNKQLVIGIPKESDPSESRISLTPEAVEVLVNHGQEIVIEKDAGLPAHYTNLDYSEKGGRIVETAQEVYRSDMILKIAPLNENEFDLLRENQLMVSSLRLEQSTGNYLRQLMHKKVTAIASERIMDSDGIYPVVRAMSTIAGSTSVLVAAEYLSNVHNGKGVVLGGISGISPTEVVILGAHAAAEFAARAALGLGAMVKVFDNSIKRLNDLQNALGQRLFTSIFHPQILGRVLKTADVVIGTVPPEETKGRPLISEELVTNMKPGSVIVDLSIDKGGCFETSKLRTHDNPSFVKHGVIHYCVPNITSRVARTASIALSNVFAPLLQNIAEAGNIAQQIKEDGGLRQGVYVLNGILTNDYLGNLYNLPSRDINLLMAAF